MSTHTLPRFASLAVSAALLLASTGVSASPAPDAPDAPLPEQSGPAQPGPPQPEQRDDVAPTTALAPAESSASADAPVVHVINAKPDDERGFIKLARHVDTSSTASGNAVLVTVRYEELCREPCGIPIDVSDRPILFFMRDGRVVSDGFRLPADAQTVTVKVKPRAAGMVGAGMALTYSLILFPIGIPLWVAGRSRAWIANGTPSDAVDFVRLRRAK
jgi:hypothetical protein